MKWVCGTAHRQLFTRVFSMPIYEYECTDCGHKLEAIQKMSDDPLKDCPECDTDSLKKLVSAAGFRLKGTGWYETDFKSGSSSGSSAGGSCGTGGCCPAAE